MISRVKKYSMENEWPGSPCLIRSGNRYLCIVALAAVAALSCVGADVVCAQTSSGDVRVASGQSVASGQDLESAGVRPGWRLVWEENFESERMDWSVWSKTVRGTADWADTQSADERCYGLRNGNLILRGIINDDLEADTARYLTGGVVTQGKKAFAFPGRIEVRARLQAATGAWPAIWLLPSDPAVRWPQGGEIDIMERLNYDGFVYQTVHSNYTYVLGHRDEPANYSTMEIDPEGFNTYGVDVFRDSVVLYVNGVRNFSYPRVPDAADTLGQFPFFQPMYLLIDMQLGGSWVGETDPEDLPVEMEVDWVRYYVPEDGRPDSPEIRPAVSIVPRPAVMRLSEGAPLRISSRRLSVYAADRQLRSTVRTWAASLEKPYAPGVTELQTGFTRVVSETVLPGIRLTAAEEKADIILSLDRSLPEEGYVLTVTAEGIRITGGDAGGVWWGLQSLSQILVQSAAAAHPGDSLSLPLLYVEDEPVFGYRGAMLDCCRHFFTVDEVKQYIDMLALHKLNVFHWHLTDDQGWRIRVRKYPLLTRTGSVRKETKTGHYGDAAAGYDGTPYGEGCWYSPEDIREVVRYASDRHITVIPEIEMPGHALAALAAYPWLGCTGGPYEVRTTWGISDDVFCIGKESTFGFLTDVLDEVCRLFPGEYVHVGGDEAPAVRWETCPDCQALMRREQLADERQLQGYLLHRIEEFLNARGKKLIGWDEILEGGVTPGATVMSWRGPEGGIRAAGQGNDVVMVPKRYFYFDYYQTAYPSANGEPLGIGGYVPLERCYSFDPFDGLDGEARTHIKGIQANTWTEYIPCFDHVQHMDLPRLSALSEVAWGRYGADYGDFTHRLASSMKAMYEYYGWIYAPYVFDGVK